MNSLSLIFSFMISSSLLGQANDDVGDSPRQGLSSFKFLPQGSVLKEVKVPRYDSDLKPTSLIYAEEIKVVNEEKVTAKELELYQFSNAKQGKLYIKLNQANYFQSKGLIECYDDVTILNNQISTHASGMILHWQTKRGFLFGPIKSTYRKKLQTTMLSPKKHLPALVATGLLTSATCSAETVQDTTTVKETQSTDSDAKKFLKEFAPTKAKSIETEEDKDEKKKPIIPEGDKDNQLDVECDGGMFFNAEKGFLNYHKNVRITEPRFKLSCSKELKIYLTPADKKKATDPKSNTDAATKAKSEKGIENIIAIGDVVIEGTHTEVNKVTKVSKTRKVKASAERAEYDYVKGSILLKGGYPIIHSTENGRTLIVTAQQKGLSITVLKDGSFETSDGKWHKRLVGLQTNK